ncbi:MAG: iron ABC transporter permease [Coriobacteriia bacterium]|nr:iron ABC transporter permease [Coriobacteriia bacterium]
MADDSPQGVQNSEVDERIGVAEANEELKREINAAFASKVTPKRWLLIGLFLLAAIIVSLCLGRYSCNPADLFGTFFHEIFTPDAPWDTKLTIAVMNIRVPRILCVVLVGAALSVAGASYQGMFKNPLVSPDLLGASAGASLGACLGLLLNMANVEIQLLAFLGAMLAVGLAVLLTNMVKGDAILGLVLGGILVSTLFQSGTSIIKLVADADDKLPAITFWLMGSFANITLLDFARVLLPMLIGFAILMFMRWRLNVLSFGEEEARTLGVNTRTTQMLVIFAATLITACSVAICGIIGYVGLVVPHLARAVVGPNYRVLLPASMAIGAAFLLVVDNFSRLIFATEIPIGILTSIVGVPFFIFIYRHNLRGW